MAHVDHIGGSSAGALFQVHSPAVIFLCQFFDDCEHVVGAVR